MKTKLKKIYTVLVLLKNLIFRKRNYKLQFIAEYYETCFKRWYYDFKHWGFQHDNLEMVSGADKLCELYANGNDKLTINVICSKKQLKNKINDYDEFIGDKQINMTNSIMDKYLYGRTYECKNFGKNNNEKKVMWICPVTLFVLGRYPNYIYIKKQ